MATIIVPGAGASKRKRWWWDSWLGNGFLGALTKGMTDVTGSHDVWMINGDHVSKMSQLTANRRLAVLQAHHLDLELYDHHFKPGAYLRTHAGHMRGWHPKRRKK